MAISYHIITHLPVGSGCEAAERPEGSIPWGCSGPSASAGGCAGDAEEEYPGSVGGTRTVEGPRDGLGDADAWGGGDWGGGPVGCICCDGDRGDSPGVELGSKCTAGSDAGGKSTGERDSDEAAGDAGDETGDSTGQSPVDSGACRGGDRGGLRPPLSSPLGAHCV